MLSGKKATTVACWLRAHRAVRLIRRDRAGADAEGATRGAPRARQSADRSHVLVNRRDALKDALARHQRGLPVQERSPASSPEVRLVVVEACGEEKQPEEAPRLETEGMKRHPLTAAAHRRQIRRTNRLARSEQIVTRHPQGRSQRAMAQRLHVSRHVVHRSITAGTFPERVPPGKRQRKLDPSLPSLRQRWEQGYHHGLQLAREIPAQGFRGSSPLVRRLLGNGRAHLPGSPEWGRGKKRQQVAPAKRRVSARQASWWFVKPAHLN